MGRLWIACLGLTAILKVFHYAYINTPQTKTLLTPRTFIIIFNLYTFFIMDDLEFLIGRSRFSSSCSVLFDLKRHSKLSAATELWDASRSLESS